MGTKFTKSPYFFVFATAFLSALSALWASYKQDESDTQAQKEVNERNEKIIKLQEGINRNSAEQLKEQRQLRLKSEEISGLYKRIAIDQTELARKSELIQKLSERNIELVTGGDNYCLVFCGDISDSGTYLEAFNNSETPLYEVRAKIRENTKNHENINGPGKLVEITIDEFFILESQNPSIDLGLIPKGGMKILGRFPMTTSLITYYDINFSARNGNWSQEIAVVRMSEGATKFRIAYRVIREVFSKGTNRYEVLSESYDPHIPTNIKKTIKWHDTTPYKGPKPEPPPKHK